MKRRANVTVDDKLLAEAKAMGINLSETLETNLRARVKAEKARRWYEENKEAIESFNRYIEKHGTFAEQVWAEEDGVGVDELVEPLATPKAAAARMKVLRKTSR